MTGAGKKNTPFMAGNKKRKKNHDKTGGRREGREALSIEQ